MSSILTNTSAMVALQTLKSINSDLGKTQAAIATGKDIASAKDNSALWSISKVMESDIAGFQAVSGSLELGESTVAVASAGAERINEILISMKQKGASKNCPVSGAVLYFGYRPGMGVRRWRRWFF